jgi:argininosuccinate lyase
MQRGVPLADLALDEFKAAHPCIDADVYDILGAERAVAAFRSYGSTAPHQVQAQLAQWRERLGLSEPSA